MAGSESPQSASDRVRLVAHERLESHHALVDARALRQAFAAVHGADETG